MTDLPAKPSLLPQHTAPLAMQAALQEDVTRLGDVYRSRTRA